MGKLEFLKTLSAEEFKSVHNIDKLEILKNKSTGKCFFTFGKNRGAVSNSYPLKQLKNPVVSEVYSEEKGEVFFLLHDRGEGSATKMEEL